MDVAELKRLYNLIETNYNDFYPMNNKYHNDVKAKLEQIKSQIERWKKLIPVAEGEVLQTLHHKDLKLRQHEEFLATLRDGEGNVLKDCVACMDNIREVNMLILCRTCAVIYQGMDIGGNMLVVDTR